MSGTGVRLRRNTQNRSGVIYFGYMKDNADCLRTTANFDNLWKGDPIKDIHYDAATKRWLPDDPNADLDTVIIKQILQRVGVIE